MFVRILTSASLLLVITAMAPWCIGCESVPDMSAPVAVSDVTSERIAVDPASDDFMIASPSTIVLESQGWAFTVHVAIPYSQVDTESLYLNNDLNELAPESTYADDCGNLVCRFLREDVFELVASEDPTPYDVTLTLSGLTIGGDEILGSDIVTVR